MRTFAKGVGSLFCLGNQRFIHEYDLENTNNVFAGHFTMHANLPYRGTLTSLGKYFVPQRRQVLLQGLEVGRDEEKDTFFEQANHVTKFHFPESNKVSRAEPLLDGRRVLASFSIAIEGRVPYSIIGTPKMGADENEDIEERFQIMGDTMRDSIEKQLNCDERRSTL